MEAIQNCVTEIKINYIPEYLKLKKQIKSSKEAHEFILNCYSEEELNVQECVKIIYMNNSNYIMGVYNLSKGNIQSCLVDIRLILAVGLKSLAINLILVHNHPGGNLKPSNADLHITEKLKKACELVDLNLLDHLIINPTKEYISLKDEGYF